MCRLFWFLASGWSATLKDKRDAGMRTPLGWREAEREQGEEGRGGRGGERKQAVCVCVCAFSGLCAPKERHEQNILVNEILKALSALFDKVWGEHTWKPHRHMRANTNTGATQAVQ